MSSSDSDDAGLESITSRISRLNQLFSGKSHLIEQRVLACREGLLDALFVLYEECCNERLMKNQYIAEFVKKYAKTVGELKRLRIGITDFEAKVVIGRGHFGEVQVVRERHSGDVYALKVLRKADTLAQQNVAFYEEERDIMAKSNSPWITQLQYAFQDAVNLYLVMEFHPGGDLLSLLARYDDQFEEPMARFYLAEMVLATHTLHTMGYVHRDVKPENVLIDRTGHIKLADFGSACRLSDAKSGVVKGVTVSNMPVGTPDYICPEVLCKMNSSETCGKFGEECDWWSLGICAYEMLYGKTPFTDEGGKMVVTYANIMNYKKCLKFPTETEVTETCLDLIRNLLTSPEKRLLYEEICVHRFFAELDLDNIRHARPPFIPNVKSNDDTSNFDEFEKARPAPSAEGFKKSTEFSGKNLPFIGFTFTKSLGNERLNSTIIEVTDPATKASLERRLEAKCSELIEVREKCKKLQNEEANLRTELEQAKQHAEEREQAARKAEAERDVFERDLTHYITETNSLKRLLELEKEERNNLDSKAMLLLKDIQAQADKASKLREETKFLEMEQMVEEDKELIAELEQERQTLKIKVERLEKELKRQCKENNTSTAKVGELQAKITQMQEGTRMGTEDLREQLEAQQKDFDEREKELQDKLDQALNQNFETTEMMQETRNKKTELEHEVYELKIKLQQEDTLRKRLSDAEERRKSLEVELHRRSLIDQREEHLKTMLNEKSQHVQQFADRIGDLEERIQNKELEFKKCEKLYKQRETQLLDRIQELQEMLETIQNERSQIEEQSILVFEENEDRLHKIQEQETTISLLKSNLNQLEQQVTTLRIDLEQANIDGRVVAHTPRRRSLSGRNVCDTPSPYQRRKSSRRSGFCQTDLSPNVSTRRKSGFSQTDFIVSPNITTRKQSGSCQTDFSPNVTMRRSAQTGTDSFMQTQTCETGSNTSFVMSSPEHKVTATCQTSPHHPRHSLGQTEVTVSVSVNTSTRGCAESSFESEDQVDESSQLPDHSTTTTMTDSTMQEESSTMNELNLNITSIPEESEEEDGDKDDEGNGSESEEEVFEEGETENTLDTIIEVVNETENATQEKKEMRRKYEEQLSDLKQEKAFLELKVDNLQREVDQFKETSHEQRIRALDLKHELREKVTNFEKQVSELKERLNKAELSLSDATETASNCQAKETSMKTRLEKLQGEHDTLRLQSRRKESSLTDMSSTQIIEERDELQTQVHVLTNKCASFNAVDQELRTSKQQVAELVPKTKELEDQLRRAQEEKTRSKIEADKARDELSEKRRQCDLLEQKVTQLKEVCAELDRQLQDFEALSNKHEERETNWTQARSTYEKAVDEREDEISEAQRHLNTERDQRQRLETQKNEMEKVLKNTTEAFTTEITMLQQNLKSERDKVHKLNQELTNLEKSSSLVELDKKSLSRKLEALCEENIHLKETISKMVTQANELKGSNIKLSKNLEDAMDKYEILASQKTDVENRLESLQHDHDHERYKMQSTLGQQTKLIDYLQMKVEAPPKKKKGLFGTGPKRPDNPPVAGIQYRELQHTLEHEREKSSTLRQQIARLKEELNAAQMETMRSKSGTLGPGYAYLSTLAMSPSAQPSPGGGSLSMSSFSESVMATPKTKSIHTPKPKKERMHHNIPHRFVTGLNSRPTKCAVCLGSVHFVKQAAKCQECNIVCHPKCVPSLPATCGLPSEYAQHFGDMMSRAKSMSTTKLTASVADLRLQLRGWMKVPSPSKQGKQQWDKKWVVLENNELKIYENEASANNCDPFVLCPANGQVTVSSAVTAAELTNTASTDLPYIFRVEFEPNTTCWPGRVQYFMTLSFQEKQKWVATLEAIVAHSHTSSTGKDAKLLGNTILSLSGDRRMEINCTLQLGDQLILVGADEGLFAMELTKSHRSRPLTQIDGLCQVYQMSTIPGLDMVAMITGCERQIVTVDLKALRRNSEGVSSTMLPQPIQPAMACTTFILGSYGDSVFMVAALAEKLLVMKYNYSAGRFDVVKEVFTSQPCSCLYFGLKCIIVGTDKFYRIELHNLAMSGAGSNYIEFLDKRDSSLAFAAFGAAHYDSFPIAVLQVAPAGEPEEFLLCFHEFGVFVNVGGRRSRDDDMKWGGLPLAFAYREPYLYICHFNTLQVVEIPPIAQSDITGCKTFLSLPSPRYLGPAQSPEAVYIGSCQESSSEIFCFRGNMAGLRDDNKENTSDSSTTMVKKRSPYKRPLADTQSLDSGIVSPPRIHTLQHSPRSNRKSSPTSSTTSTSSTETSDASSNYVVRKKISIPDKRRRYSISDSDTSF